MERMKRNRNVLAFDILVQFPSRFPRHESETSAPVRFSKYSY